MTRKATRISQLQDDGLNFDQAIDVLTRSAQNHSKKHFTFIDLFAGCGGLSEGFYKQGFHALTHVEIDHFACKSLRKRMQYFGYQDEKISVLEKDVTDNDIIEKIENMKTII